jgi:hypothetical protein
MWAARGPGQGVPMQQRVSRAIASDQEESSY